MHRWKQHVWAWAGAAAMLAGCVAHGPPPQELIEARTAYQRVAESPAVQQERPRDLSEAWAALLEAEREYDRSKNSARTRSLAYVALRKAQLAEVRASLELAERQRAAAAQALQETQQAERQRALAELEAAQQQLAEARRMRDEAARLAEARRLQAEAAQLQVEAQRQQEAQQLAEAEQRRREAEAQRQQEALRLAEEEEQRRREAEAQAQRLAAVDEELRRRTEQLEAERRAREEAERRATQALSNLEQLGDVQVQEDARGMVLTLSGSVLFASGEAELLPTARNRLSEVAEALRQTDNLLTVEGHTDAAGSDLYNEELSRRRAEEVRDFLVSRGIPSERIEVRGLGEYRPVASNVTPEGRANNRRVEIIVQQARAATRERPEPSIGTGGSGEDEER